VKEINDHSYENGLEQTFAIKLRHEEREIFILFITLVESKVVSTFEYVLAFGRYEILLIIKYGNELYGS